MFKKAGWLFFIILSFGTAYSVESTNDSYRGMFINANVSIEPMLRIGGYYASVYTGNSGILDLRIGGDMTPVSVNSWFKYNFNFPVSNFCLFGGITAGTGWPLGNDGANGIGMSSNFYDADYIQNSYARETLVKGYMKFSAGAGAGFDVADIFPGDWNHIQAKTTQEIYYQYLLGSRSDDDVWMYENTGDRMKSLRYAASYFAGYEMPIFLHNIGVLINTDLDVKHYSMSTITSGGWGSDLLNIKAGLLQTYYLDSKGNTIVEFVMQWKNDRAYKSGFGKELNLWSRKLIGASLYDYWHIEGVVWTLNHRF